MVAGASQLETEYRLSVQRRSADRPLPLSQQLSEARLRVRLKPQLTRRPHGRRVYQTTASRKPFDPIVANPHYCISFGELHE